MSEYRSGRTQVLPARIPAGSTERIVPEFAAGEVGKVTHTRYRIMQEVRDALVPHIWGSS